MKAFIGLIAAIVLGWILYATVLQREPGVGPQANDAPAAGNEDDLQSEVARGNASGTQAAGFGVELADEEEAATDAPGDLSETETAARISRLYSTDQLDEAEAEFAAALKRFPESVRLKYVHDLAYAYLTSAGRNEQAFEHLRALVDMHMANAAKSSGAVDSFARNLGRLADRAQQLGGPQQAATVLEAVEEQARSQFAESHDVLDAIRGQRAVLDAKSGRLDQGRELAEQVRADAVAALEASPQDVSAVARVANALRARVQVEQAAAEGDAKAATAALLDFLHSQAKARPDDSDVVNSFASEHLQEASRLAYNDPIGAAALLARVEEFEEFKLPEVEDNRAASATSEYPNAMIYRLRAVIAESRQRVAQLGGPAEYPDTVDAWVNVDQPVDPQSLRGQVVLLDFFAVWCGPCIATFPHLRQWHDEYADQGLHIIGVTEYHSYGWNVETNRAQRERDIAPEDERAAMEQFAKHHQLRHPIAYTADDQLQNHYHLVGIPHALLIDRQGNVRMFRIGSGEQNARDLEAAIKECLAETATEVAANL